MKRHLVTATVSGRLEEFPLTAARTIIVSDIVSTVTAVYSFRDTI